MIFCQSTWTYWRHFACVLCRATVFQLNLFKQTSNQLMLFNFITLKYFSQFRPFQECLDYNVHYFRMGSVGILNSSLKNTKSFNLNLSPAEVAHLHQNRTVDEGCSSYNCARVVTTITIFYCYSAICNHLVV